MHLSNLKPFQRTGKNIIDYQLAGFTFSFTLGLGPVPWVLVGEIFPVSVRSACAGVSTCFCFTFIFLANFRSVLNSFNTW